MSDYELMASEPDQAASPPSSPFSFVSSIHPVDSPSDLSLAESILADDQETVDVRSVSGSEYDWSFVHQGSGADHAHHSSAFASNVTDSVCSIRSPSRTPSPQLKQPSFVVEPSPLPTPRERSPQVLQIPVLDASAQPLTLVRLLNLPPYYTLEDLVNLLTKRTPTICDTFRYIGRVPLPLWISFRPPNAQVEAVQTKAKAPEVPTSSALLRFMNPEDAAGLSDILEYMKNRLAMMDGGEFWFWLLDVDTILLSDEEAEKGEEDKGLLWVADWLRSDTISDMQTKNTAKKAASESITSILLTPLPYEVCLSDLVNLFTTNAAESAPRPRRISLLPDLAVHTIFLPCCILQFPDHVTANQAMTFWSRYDTLFFEVLLGGAPCSLEAACMSSGTRRCPLEWKLGDWWFYSGFVRNAQIWEHPSLATKDAFRAKEDVSGLLEEFPSHVARRRRLGAMGLQSSPHCQVSTKQSALLTALPPDVDLDEIVKVYTTPPVLSSSSLTSSAIEDSFKSAESMHTDVPNRQEDSVRPQDSSQSTRTIPLPSFISILYSHPKICPGSRMAVISFASAADFAEATCLLPPSMWFHPGTWAHPRGSFVKPEERDGTEQLYQCSYVYGDYSWLHHSSLGRRTTWVAAV
ncbi:hypothetical protein DACRYDRAFT_119758 [Dacryopinax primogenitus]|uniref:Uncharacterized protein n=1 Tax=Dacryopinax primogenitus (strain DJM 731) TaxID=1858805 RepID=M5FUL2_DACPD|nr:uncharacterized protein DACRYDRAFT_119758 [Dacryopinax primogenitus]EJT96941.1 hypothetical protein DACRYDRAFT_119758 [Dacryopinax primogenitus]